VLLQLGGHLPQVSIYTVGNIDWSNVSKVSCWKKQKHHQSGYTGNQTHNFSIRRPLPSRKYNYTHKSNSCLWDSCGTKCRKFLSINNNSIQPLVKCTRKLITVCNIAGLHDCHNHQVSYEHDAINLPIYYAFV